MSLTDALGDYLDAAREAALRAAVVLEQWRQRFQVREKGRFDLVTDADLASQRTIAEYLAGRFPTHAFLGEEDAKHQPSRSRRAADLDRGPHRRHHQLRPRLSVLLRLHRPTVRGRIGGRRHLRSVAAGDVRGGQGHGSLAERSPTVHESGRFAGRGAAGDGLSAGHARPGTDARLVALLLAADALAAPHRLDGIEPGLRRGRTLRRLLGLR